MAAAAEAALLEACEQLNTQCGGAAMDVAFINHVHFMSPAVERNAAAGGEGLFANDVIPAGTLLLSTKPIVMVLDRDVDTHDSTAYNADTAYLILELAKLIHTNPSTWESVSHLFPRPHDMGKIPHWECDPDDPALAQRVASTLGKLTALSAADRARIPDIVKYNALSIETCAEQLCHASRYNQLSGLGLYNDPSLFNHACQPNVARFCIGEVAVFRTNQEVPRGDELCISYIESELLTEPLVVRNEALGDRDFVLTEDTGAPLNGISSGCGGGSAAHGGGARGSSAHVDEEQQDMGPALEREVLDDVLATGPLARLATIKELLSEPGNVARLKPSDYKELHLIQGLSLGQLGVFAEARVHWEKCLAFNRDHCPPHDEGTVCYAVQAALCSVAAGALAAAAHHAATAILTHAIAFGPTLTLFQVRYSNELTSCENTSLANAAQQLSAALTAVGAQGVDCADMPVLSTALVAVLEAGAAEVGGLSAPGKEDAATAKRRKKKEKAARQKETRAAAK
jgi:hypothetical protein